MLTGQQEEEAEEEGASRQGSARRPGSAVAARIAQGLSSMLDLAGLPNSSAGQADNDGGGQAGQRAAAAHCSTTAGSASQRQSAGPALCTFHPLISERAQARQARSPAELHADGAARGAKLASCGAGLLRGSCHLADSWSAC